MTASAKPEPAIKSYFFGKGYQDLVTVARTNMRLNIAEARLMRYRRPYLFFVAAALMLFGPIFVGLSALVHAVILSVFTAVIFVIFSIVWVVEVVFMWFRRFFVACPHCYAKVRLPVYLCDSCREKHRLLMPNRYGIFYHKCTCSRRLPATFFVNRGRLQALCPVCEKSLHRDLIETRRIFIPLLGGPSAGKTTLMVAMVRNVMDSYASKIGYVAEFNDRNTKDDYDHIVTEMRHGRKPLKTTERLPKAFTVALKRSGVTKWQLYLYDPSGEVYQSSDELAHHRYNAYISGAVLAIDPFSLSTVQAEYQGQPAEQLRNIQASELDAYEALSRYITVMEMKFGLKQTGKIKLPLAVVLTKSDAFDLENKLGRTKINMYRTRHPELSYEDARDRVIVEQLEAWGEKALVLQIRTRFSNARFFACSALGRIPDATDRDFVPHGVMDPLTWICRVAGGSDFVNV